MSGLVQGLVWRAVLQRAGCAPGAAQAEPPPVWAKPVLARLADEADDEGHDVFPAVATVAGDLDLSEATVQRCLKWLRAVDLIRVDGSLAGGRGRATRYWVNVGQLRQIQKGPSRTKAVPPPTGFEGAEDGAEEAESVAKGSLCDTLYGSSAPLKGRTQDVKGVKKGLKRRTGATLPFTRIPVKRAQGCAREARRAGVRADGRPPGGPSSPSTIGVDVFADAQPPVDRAAWDAWAGLLVALVDKGLAEEARSWLHRRAVERVGDRVVVMAASPMGAFAGERLRTGALAEALRLAGWRVEVSGAGG